MTSARRVILLLPFATCDSARNSIAHCSRIWTIFDATRTGGNTPGMFSMASGFFARSLTSRDLNPHGDQVRVFVHVSDTVQAQIKITNEFQSGFF